MSFAEFGASSSAAKRRQQQQQQQAFSGNGGSSSLGLDSISESLLQYQRNVDILGKIVRSLSTSHVYSPNMVELSVQYEAQVDVIGQLEQRVQTQLQQQLQQSTAGLNTNPQKAMIITKLKRDFERVQLQARSLQDAAVPKIKAIRAAANPSNNGPVSRNATGTDTVSGQQLMSDDAIRAEQQRMLQLRMQEDRLAAEIMREREEEIRNINRGMHQVNEIYKDLAHIVGSQQEQIDTIETQMDDARANAEAGLKQVEKANERYGNSNCSIM